MYVYTLYIHVALKYHPDTNRAPDAVSKFRDVQEAYKVLSDTSTRRQYDSDNNLTTRKALKGVNWSKGMDSDGGSGAAASVDMFRKRHEARMVAEQHSTSTITRVKYNKMHMHTKLEHGNQHSPQSVSSVTKPIQRVSNQGTKSIGGLGAVGGLVLFTGLVVLLAAKKNPVDQLNSNLKDKLGKR